MIIQQGKPSKFMGVDEYRKLPFINYSACKDFDEDRTKFYRKYITKEIVEEKKGSVMVFGDLIHCLALSPEDFDDKFSRLSVGVTPKPQMKEFCDNLWKVTKSYMDESRQVSKDMKSMMEEAFQMTAYNRNGERVAFKGKTLEYAISEFAEKGEMYYSALRENYNKSVIDSRTFDMAERCVSELLVNPTTREIFSVRNDKRYLVFKEHAILFKHLDQDVKALCDIVIVDRDLKKILLYDLKSSDWDIEAFDLNIIKNRYYLQWAMYHLALKSWAQENGFGDFEIVPMQFIVVSPDMSKNPLIYTTSERDVHHGIHGFKRNNKLHKGLDRIITEMVWHTAFGIWNMSYQDYQNKGIRRVSLFEE